MDCGGQDEVAADPIRLVTSFGSGRYSRQLAMPEWGKDRQTTLSTKRVVVIGAGGVKSTLLMSLVAAGVGELTILEFDRVELSNLNRQCLYTERDVGRFKGDCAREFLHARNSEVKIDWINDRVSGENISTYIKSADFVVEGGESPHGRNVVNRACLESNIPFVHASAQFSYGYVLSVVPALRTACFACHFPKNYERDETTGPVPVNVLSCQVAGTLAAAEVLKWLMGHHKSMHVNRRLCFASLLLSGEFEVVRRPRRRQCPVCAPIYAAAAIRQGGTEARRH